MCIRDSDTLTLGCGMLTLGCGMLTLECGMLTLGCGFRRRNPRIIACRCLQTKRGAICYRKNRSRASGTACGSVFGRFSNWLNDFGSTSMPLWGHFVATLGILTSNGMYDAYSCGFDGVIVRPKRVHKQNIHIFAKDFACHGSHEDAKESLQLSGPERWEGVGGG